MICWNEFRGRDNVFTFRSLKLEVPKGICSFYLKRAENMKFRRRVTLSDTVKNQQHTDVAEVMGTHEITFKKPVGEKKRAGAKEVSEMPETRLSSEAQATAS